jgi:cell division protein FtsQ
VTARPHAPRARLGWRVPVALAAALMLVVAPWWAPPLLARLSFFRVKRVEVYGTHYIPPDEILARLRVDTTASVWDDPRPLAQRVAEHPEVRAVAIERDLPGTLVVRVTERLPVAFVPAGGGLRATDAEGSLLPLDPSRVALDLPVLERLDTALIRLLADVHGASPELFARISGARRAAPNEIQIALAGALVRANADVTARRLADVVPVQQDLAQRGAPVSELDLRFRDQVIARRP